MVLFRTENMNDLDTPQRMIPNLGFVSSVEADRLIANEIRKGVNGSKERNIYSYSLSLGCVLFKYNYYADNPLLILPHSEIGGYVQFNVIYPSGKSEVIERSFNIEEAYFEFSRNYPNCLISIIDFQVFLNNNQALDNYLVHHTNTHRKKFASSEKDSEIVFLQEQNALIIDEYSINAVFFLYALQWRYFFLNRPQVNEALKYAIYYRFEHEKRFTEEEYNAFCIIIDYLTFSFSSEMKLSSSFVQPNAYYDRTVYLSDGYNLALAIINDIKEDIDNYLSDIIEHCFCYDIWSIFNNSPKA